MNIIGHTEVCDYLSQRAVKGDFHHAYLFVGPASVGKRTVAEWWTSLLDVGDVIRISREGAKEDLEEKNTTGIISVGAIRTLISATRFTTHDGKLRAILIDGVESMNDEASNALLKTLEEPPPSTLFILLTNDISAVSGTVRSRCMTVRFSLVPSGIIEHALTGPRAAECALFSAGRPGIAVQLNAEPGVGSLDTFTAHLTAAQALCAQSRAQQLLRLQEWTEMDTDALEYILHTDTALAEKKDISALYDAIKASRRSRQAAQKQSALELFFCSAV